MSITAITDRRVHIQPSDVHNVLSGTCSPTATTSSWTSTARKARGSSTPGAAAPSSISSPTSPPARSATTIRGSTIPSSAIASPTPPSTSRPTPTSTRPTWRSSSRRSRAWPFRFPQQAHVLHRRRRPRHRERGQDGHRLESPKELSQGIPVERGTQIMHLREAFHGRTGYTLSLTNTDSEEDAVLPEVRLAAHRKSEAAVSSR